MFSVIKKVLLSYIRNEPSIIKTPDIYRQLACYANIYTLPIKETLSDDQCWFPKWIIICKEIIWVLEKCKREVFMEITTTLQENSV